MKRIVSGIVLIIVLASMQWSAFKVMSAEASGTIYIRADGSVDPPDAPILNDGNATYTFIDDIFVNAPGIGVERDNIVIDGNGHTLTGSNESNCIGITLSGRVNVTIRNTQIKVFTYGVYLINSYYSSIIGNNIENNNRSIILGSSSNNSISGNNLTANKYDGIAFAYVLGGSSSNYNSIIGNNITNNMCGIRFLSSSSLGNMIYHNNFIDNHQQVSTGSANIWDGGYPSGGNYWSDYIGTDLFSGLYQNETGSDGICDAPYVIDGSNRDNYPLMNAIHPLAGDINGDDTVDNFDCEIIALAFGSTRSDLIWDPIADINRDGIVDIFDMVGVALHFGETG